MISTRIYSLMLTVGIIASTFLVSGTIQAQLDVELFADLTARGNFELFFESIYRLHGRVHTGIYRRADRDLVGGMTFDSAGNILEFHWRRNNFIDAQSYIYDSAGHVLR